VANQKPVGLKQKLRQRPLERSLRDKKNADFSFEIIRRIQREKKRVPAGE
jgi:hypothetical protein